MDFGVTGKTVVFLVRVTVTVDFCITRQCVLVCVRRYYAVVDFGITGEAGCVDVGYRI